MIYIERDREDEAGKPIRPGENWFETAEAARQKALVEGKDHDADGKIYGHDHARAALEKLFHGKCAYCESQILNSEWDVEHFRPKGRVAERQDHPGYYWLAYEWTNLYPACKLCNQHRKDKPTWEDPEAGKTAGKLDQFPVEPEEDRAMRPEDDLERERPLLLDPCRDRPEEHLRFTVLGEVAPVGAEGKGAVSIEVFHLDRRRLRDLRRDRIETTLGTLTAIRRHEQAGNAEAVKDFQDLLDRHLLADRNPYAAASRSVVEDPEAFGL